MYNCVVISSKSTLSDHQITQSLIIITGSLYIMALITRLLMKEINNLKHEIAFTDFKMILLLPLKNVYSWKCVHSDVKLCNLLKISLLSVITDIKLNIKMNL